MRIAHVVDYYQPQMGYQEYFLATRQASAGHDVHVVTSDRYMPWENYAETIQPLLGPRIVGTGVTRSEGVVVHRLPCRFEFRRNAIWIAGLRRVLREIAPDVVSVDGVFTLTAGRVARMNHGLGLPLVFDSHVADYNTGSTSLRFRLMNAAFRSAFAPAIRAEADALVAVDQGTRDVLCRELGVPSRDVPIIPLGADEFQFRPDPAARARMRETLGVGGDVVVGYAGKLYPSKRLELLIAAASRLAARSVPSFQLVIVGGGPEAYLRQLRESARGLTCVRFVERLFGRDDLNAFFNACDVGVWPAEPSNGIQEAMAAGLPVVLPDVNSQRVPNDWYVADGNGALFRRDDADALAGALEPMIRDSPRRAVMARNARAYVERELGWSTVAERFVAEFDRAIAARRARLSGSRRQDGR